MKHRLIEVVILIVVLFVLFLVIDKARAECTFVWKPGDVSYITAGHNVKFIVDAENVEAYQHQKQIDEKFLPMPPINSDFDEAIKKLENVHACGDYREIEDKDLD